MIKILVVTHGDLCKEFISTAESIVGRQQYVVALSLSQDESLASMSERIKNIMDNAGNTSGILVLTDMLGGTPCNASLPLCTSCKMEIVTGINLYMLISALINRDNMSLEDLAGKIMADGKKNIANAKEIFLKKLE